MIKLFLKALLLLTILITSSARAEDESQKSLNLLDGLGFGMQDDILTPEQAFQLSTLNDNKSFSARWIIADGHYLYRDKMVVSINDKAIQTKALQFSTAEEKDDPIFNKKLFVYHDEAQVILPFINTKDSDSDVTFKVKYQGCSEISGICYPPQTKEFTVRLSPISAAQAASIANTSVDNVSEPVSEQDEIANALRSGDTWLTLIAFFGFGLLLAFTPCVFPMIPILSGIIVGQGENITTKKHCFYRSFMFWRWH